MAIYGQIGKFYFGGQSPSWIHKLRKTYSTADWIYKWCIFFSLEMWISKWYLWQVPDSNGGEAVSPNMSYFLQYMIYCYSDCGVVKNKIWIPAVILNRLISYNFHSVSGEITKLLDFFQCIRLNVAIAINIKCLPAAILDF